jgi:hypothetical protein
LDAFCDEYTKSQEGTLKVQAIGPVRRVVVTGGGADVTGQAGTHLLGQIADGLGIAAGWSAVMADTTTRSTAHDRGRLLTQVSMMIAAGGRCLSDLKTLRNQPLLFGEVASEATAWRAMQQVDDDRLAGLVQVRQAAIRRLLEQAPDDEVVLDIDASLVNVDSDAKQGAASNFKGGFGFHPMLCFIEPAGLAVGMLRPGNATANNIGDQLAVVDQAIAALPDVWRAGHQPGDAPETVERVLRVRADTAAGGRTMMAGLAARNVVFSVGMRVTADACAAIRDIPDEVWVDARNADGSIREGAQVCEAPDLVPANAPAGTRAIVRRERPHPGASLRLWDYNGMRHQVTLTNDDSDDIVALERFHRSHAIVENRIKQLKDCGLARMPFSGWDANRAWFETVLTAALLLAGLRTLVSDDPELSKAEPRRLRYTLLHVAARIVHRSRRVFLRLDRTWPWTGQLLAANDRLPGWIATPA